MSGSNTRRRFPNERGMTEDEIMRDRSQVDSMARYPMMRSTDSGILMGGKEMMNPLNFEETFRKREEAKAKGTRMKSGGRVRGDGCAIKGKTKGRIV